MDGTKQEIRDWQAQMRADSVQARLTRGMSFTMEPGFVPLVEYGQEEYEEREAQVNSMQGNPYVEDGGIASRADALPQLPEEEWML